MRVLVVGSEGFIGRHLVKRLLAAEDRGQSPISRLTLLDVRMGAHAPEARLRLVQGDISDSAVLAAALQGGVDLVFHLASVPGAAAEQDFDSGLKVNLRATIEIFEALRRAGGQPKLVFASTIGVYGALPVTVDEDTPADPPWSYGAHKLIGEVLAADYGRRGFVDARVIRIPGIVARPPTTGMSSVFLSDLIRELAADRPYVCPVGPEGTAWWMSRPQVVENLLHAATLSAAQVSKQRVYLMPVLRLSIAEVVEALARKYGEGTRALVSYKPDMKLQAALASYPPMSAPRAEAAGFRHDGTVEQLITRALEG